jgi:hypothetical protein
MPIKTVWMVFLFAVLKQNGLIGDRIMWIANRWFSFGSVVINRTLKMLNRTLWMVFLASALRQNDRIGDS